MLTEIMRNFGEMLHELDTHDVKEVMINCMSIREPKGIYTRLVNELKAPRATAQNDVIKQAQQLLNGNENVLTYGLYASGISRPFDSFFL